MNRDKQLLKYCLDRIALGEPSIIAGINGFGKDIIYSSLVKKVKKGVKHHYIYATTAHELHTFLQSVEKDENTRLIIVNLTILDDVSWFFNTLEQLRWKRTTSFNFIVFTNIKEIYQSLKAKQKILIRALNCIPPVDFSDTQLLLRDFRRRFMYKTSQQQDKLIFELSGGHVGLIKSLYMLAKDKSAISLAVDQLLPEGLIDFRLQAIAEEFPQDVLRAWVSNSLSQKDKEILETLYFLRGTEAFSPLIKPYVVNLLKSIEMNRSIDKKTIDFEIDLTAVEKNLFNQFKHKLGQIVGRDAIAQILWGANIEHSYSDWAIDQVIHRIREKLKKTKSPYTLLTKKGVGFILTSK